VWAVIIMGTMMLFNLFQQPQQGRQSISYSDLLGRIEGGQISSVTIQGQDLTATTSDGQTVYSFVPRDDKLVPLLLDKKVEVKAEPMEGQPWYVSMLVSLVPMLLLVFLWVYLMRQMQGGGGGKAFSFGHSRAKMLNQNDKKRVTFADVAGVDEAKDELQEVVEFLSNPKKFTRLGGRIPKGCLLVGPPGTGKTLLARAVAGEAGVPFFSISGSDFVEMFVGVGASRVRDLFEQGKKNAPCIIFIDEIDAVGRKRGAGLGGGNDEREQTLNQMLVEMDGFESNEGVILIAATNRPDVLDPALLRPGRFDRQVVVSTPDRVGRKQILTIHSKKTPLARDVDLGVIAAGTPGFSGADLENLVNEAALQAARDNRDSVLMRDFEYAKDKIIMGRERRSLILSEQEKRITAYHEGGHALAAKLLPGSDPVHKVSIIPRGQALGITMQLPEEDRHGYSRDFLLNNLVMLLGGRVAEEIIFEDVTTGASNDIERATNIARRMVCEWGMSENVGTIAIGESGQEVFIGREWVQNKNYSEHTAQLVDREVRRILDEAHERCRRLLTDNIEILHRIAEALLVREAIDGRELDLLVEGKELPPQQDGGPDRGQGGSGPSSGAPAARQDDGKKTAEEGAAAAPASGADRTEAPSAKPEGASSDGEFTFEQIAPSDDGKPASGSGSQEKKD
ncbi:MAG: ATP-dependent zinc metalloprotease FtsH, partial [Desulfovibrionaceae bacterium]|nr:ATP-dependent zinc metalloprotease FtsH [Desulfovibrionaceae bacterium]